MGLCHKSYFYPVKILIYVIVAQIIVHKTHKSVSEVMNLGWIFFLFFFFSNRESFIFWSPSVLYLTQEDNVLCNM